MREGSRKTLLQRLLMQVQNNTISLSKVGWLWFRTINSQKVLKALIRSLWSKKS